MTLSFPGTVRGHSKDCPQHPPSVFLCFLVSYEESNPKDPAVVTESKEESTEASAVKNLEKKEK